MVVQSDSVNLQSKMDLGPLVHIADLPGRQALQVVLVMALLLRPL